jgi:hypothetical protein
MLLSEFSIVTATVGKASVSSRRKKARGQQLFFRLTLRQHFLDLIHRNFDVYAGTLFLEQHEDT